MTQPTATPGLQSAVPGQPTLQTLQLEDIHLPAAPSLWPPAPGWWIAFALLLAALIYFSMRAVRYRRVRRQRLYILNALKVLQQDLEQQADPEVFASINQLLRRLALMFYSRDQVASLTGRDWLEFLDRSGDTQEFTQGSGKLLGDVPYQNRLPENTDIEGFSAAVENWVKRITREVKS